MRRELFGFATVLVAGLAGAISVSVDGWRGIVVGTMLFLVAFGLLNAAIRAAREGAR